MLAPAEGRAARLERRNIGVAILPTDTELSEVPSKAVRVLLATRKDVVQTRTRAINHLKALVVNAPEAIRGELRPFKTGALVIHCAARHAHR